MSRATTVGVAGCVAWIWICGALLSRVAAGQEPVFRSATDTVRVYATVTNSDGRLVTDLSRDEFEIKEGGVVQPIAVFDNRPASIRLIVLLDLSCSMRVNLPLMRSATELLLTKLRPEDLAKVATFSGDTVRMSEAFTRDIGSLNRVLPQKESACGGSPLRQTIYAVMNAFEPVRGDERRVLLVFSDGADQNSAVRDADVIDRARRNDVMIYSVAMLGIDDTLATAVAAHQAFTALAAESGGGFIELSDRREISAAFVRIADELRSQYLLGFEPSKRDGRTHNIDVRSLRKGMKVRARRSYVAPGP